MMVPELEDMVKQRYSSKQEVKQIVRRRQDFEYRCKRRAALKEDYLRYMHHHHQHNSYSMTQNSQTTWSSGQKVATSRQQQQ